MKIGYRQMIKKNQEELIEKAENYIDEQLEKGSAKQPAKSGKAE